MATASQPSNLLSRTILNLEQAKGLARHHTTARDILQAFSSENSETTSTSLDVMSNSALEAVHASPRVPTGGSITATSPEVLTTNLNESTALLRNLRARNSILAADLARTAAFLAHQEERAAKMLAMKQRSKTRWTLAFLCSSSLWVLYLWWCWCMRVEFEYIRKRRVEAFGIH